MNVGVHTDERRQPLSGASTPASEVARVEQRSAAFKKELGLADLVLQQIVYVVGIVWVGAAAKLGQSHIVFWLAAMLLFYLPQAAVVIHLSRALPLEGGRARGIDERKHRGDRKNKSEAEGEAAAERHIVRSNRHRDFRR